MSKIKKPVLHKHHY